MADTTLSIKDGNGSSKNLKVYDDGAGLVPYHAVSGAVDVNVTFPDTQPVSFEATSVLTASIFNFPATQSVKLTNTGSLTASVFVSNWPSAYTVTSSYAQPVVVVQSGSVSSVVAASEYATAVQSKTGSAAESQVAWGQQIGQLICPTDSVSIKSIIISNQLDSYLYLALHNTPISATTSSYTYCIDPYSTYECLTANLGLYHTVVAHPSASSGIATMTVTFRQL
jgi:hypothetical protein